MTEPKILALDIETLPAVAVTFSLFKPIFSPEHIMEHPRLGGFSYQWSHWKKPKWSSEYHHPEGRKGMLKLLRDLLDEADVVLHYNGQSFDIPWIRGELMLEGFEPPSPVQQIDLYRHLKRNSKFISGKLDYAAQRLLEDRKEDHSGISMWIGCLQGKRRDWDQMRKYALKDTELLFPLYERVRPYIESQHPNMALLRGKAMACTKCGSSNVQRQGVRFTQAGKFQRYLCRDCHSWFRGAYRIETTEGR